MSSILKVNVISVLCDTLHFVCIWKTILVILMAINLKWFLMSYFGTKFTLQLSTLILKAVTKHLMGKHCHDQHKHMYTYYTSEYFGGLVLSRLSARHLMMTSSNGNNFRVTGPLCGEFTGHRWIPLTKASDAELWSFLWSASEQTVE